MSISDDPVVRQLRNDAIRHDEWATKKYWLYLFHQYIFPERHYVVATEQPPVDLNSQRRIDLTVEDYPNGRFCLLIVEAKKGRATPQDIREVESQLYSAAYEHYTGNPDRDQIWVMSVFGPHARIWAFDSEQKFLTPALPVTGDIGDRNSYIDFKTSEKELMDFFAFVKDNPAPTDAVVASPESSDNDTAMSGMEILDAGSVEFVRVVEWRTRGPEVETADGRKLRTERERWQPAQCDYDGSVMQGHKYVGNSGVVYFTQNDISEDN